jgi:Type I phosphodiesterase / nucleotide pyrophosphatase
VRERGPHRLLVSHYTRDIVARNLPTDPLAAGLADLTPSLLAALGTDDFENVFGVPPTDGVCLLLVDGLGWEILRAHSSTAPFLNSVADGRAGAGRPIPAGFPATTTSSLASIGTGLRSGEHGFVGYTFAVPESHGVLNALKWSEYGGAKRLDNDLPPEQIQPHPTTAQMAARHGVRMERVGPEHLKTTPLSRALFRGEHAYHPSYSAGDLSALAAARLAQGPCLVLAYYSPLDTTAHVRGAGSEEMALELGHVDRLALDIAERLPRRTTLVITGDHGMVDIPDDGKIDLADAPDLARGVAMVGGEARVRHLYVENGAREEVLGAWQTRLDDTAWIGTRDEVIAAGWFGRVTEHARPRIGDVVMAARGRIGVVHREVDPVQASLRGHHGSFSDAEMLVPLLIVEER